MALNLQILDESHQAWVGRYGQGRNEQDWRFGQWVHNMIGLPAELRMIRPDGFYAETADDAYHELKKLVTWLNTAPRPALVPLFEDEPDGMFKKIAQ